MKLIIASNNKHKIIEIKQILGKYFDTILSLNEAGIDHETIEDGQTFLENANKKATEIAEISGCFSIADDSGLCVDALGGEPGIYSARYCGHHGDDEANNDLLIKNLTNEPNKSAHYTCAIVLAAPNGKTFSAEDYMHGEIILERQGNNGFGYDPIFIPEGFSESFAQMGSEIKNSISHRYRATEKLCKYLKENYPDALKNRYKVDSSLEEYLLTEQIAKNRGLLQKGGTIDEDSTKKLVLKEFKEGILTRVVIDNA